SAFTTAFNLTNSIILNLIFISWQHRSSGSPRDPCEMFRTPGIRMPPSSGHFHFMPIVRATTNGTAQSGLTVVETLPAQSNNRASENRAPQLPDAPPSYDEVVKNQSPVAQAAA